jgi:hypothetical protein
MLRFNFLLFMDCVLGLHTMTSLDSFFRFFGSYSFNRFQLPKFNLSLECLIHFNPKTTLTIPS